MTATRRTLRRGEPRRVAVLGVLAASLAVLGVVSVRSEPANTPAAPASVATIGLNSESSAFYCGGLEHVQGVVESDVAIADLASTPRVVEVTTTNERNEVSLRQVRVEPGRVVHLSPAGLVGGSLEAVSVVSNGGDVAVTEAIRGVDGAAVAPCLTRAATSWWLTGGSTEKGESLVLSVFNPYASSAVFSVTLQTPGGVAVPQAFQQYVLGPHQLAALSVHAVAPNQSPITTHIVASDGNVVVYGIGRSTQGGASISLLPGTPSTPAVTTFPVANSATGRTTQLLLANPGATPVVTDVRVWAPADCASHCPVPFVVDIAPGGTSLLTVSPSTRVPVNRPMATEVTASGGGVVAVQRVTVSGAVGQSSPLHDPWPSGASQYVLVNPLASGFDDVGIINPTSSTLHVTLSTVTSSGPAAIGSTYTVSPHGSIVLGPGSLRGMVDGVLVLHGDGPMSAGADVHGALRGSSVLAAAPAQ